MGTRMRTRQEIRANVARTNDAIALYDGRIVPAKTLPRFGKGVKMTTVVGYTYTIELDGKTFKGNAKGVQEFITLKEV
jgi:hypothetical protein